MQAPITTLIIEGAVWIARFTLACAIGGLAGYLAGHYVIPLLR